jgi:flagellar basal-body rod protein FlgC
LRQPALTVRFYFEASREKTRQPNCIRITIITTQNTGNLLDKPRKTKYPMLMKHINIAKIAGSLIVLFLLISCRDGKDVKIMIHNEKQRNLLENIIQHKDYKVKIINNGNFLTIKNATMEMLWEIRNVLSLQSDVINDNIKNASTTKAENGGPYIRKYVKISVENGIEVIEDMENKTMYVYDPTHPDTKQSGERQGYVEYPNINIMTEMTDLIEVNRFYESISKYLENNYKNIIF